MEALLHAIHTLYNATDGTTRAQANEWLMNYQRTKDAWSSSLRLLHHPSAEVQYFGAVTLYEKAKADWTLASSTTAGSSSSDAGLSLAEQSQLMNQLMVELKLLCGASTDGAAATPSTAAKASPAVLSKLALALAVMASRTTGGPADLLASLAPLAAAPFPSPSSLVLLELLAALGEEVSRAKMSYTRAEEVKSQLRKQTEQVGAAVARALDQAYKIVQQAQQQQQMQHPELPPQLDAQVSKCLAVILSWTQYGLELQHLHGSGLLSSLLSLAAGWVSVPLSSGGSVGTSLALLGQVVEVLEKVLGDSTYPRPAGRDQAVDALLAWTIQVAKPVYERTIAECVRRRSRPSPADSALLDRADELCVYICRISSAIGEAEMEFLACYPAHGGDDFPTLTPGGTNYVDDDNDGDDSKSPSSSSPPNPLHLAYFEFHLLLSSHPYHRVLVETSLDVWSNLQDQPVAERKFPILKGEIFVQLLATLIQAASFPATFRGWGLPLARPAASAAASGAVVDPAASYFADVFLEDPDSFLRFRAILLETFLSIQAILGPKYVQLIAQALENGGAGESLPWQRVEALLSALLPITRELVAEFADEHVALESKRATHELLATVMRKLWSLTPYVPAAEASAGSAADISAAMAAASLSAPPSLLLATSCAFLKSYVFLYEYAAPQLAQEMLQRSIVFLIGASAAGGGGTAAASAASASSSPARKRAPASASSEAGASFASFSASTGSSDSPSILAGEAFKSLCEGSGGVLAIASGGGGGGPSASQLLIRSPQLLGEIVRMLHSVPGFSAAINVQCKALWMQGLASLVARIAYSAESCAQIEKALGAAAPAASSPSSPSSPAVAPEDYSIAKASSYLQEITNPGLNSLRAVFAHIAAAQARQQQLAPGEMEAVRAELVAQISLLQATLQPIATPSNVDALQFRSRLLDAVTSVPPANAASVPPSVAIGVFSSAWPLLQQATTILLPLRDAEGLECIVGVYATAITLLYPHELAPLLPTLLQAALHIYQAAPAPLPAVLELVRTAVETYTYGAQVDMRDMWNNVITQIYKVTMLNTKESFKTHAEVFESFFHLCTSLYENCTYCFLTNPSNTLTHILQFSVSCLDSLSQTRGVLQRILYFLQQLLSYTAAIDVLPLEKRDLYAMFAQVYAEQGSGLLRQLISNLTSEPALPPLMDQKVAAVLHASISRFPDQTKNWIEKAIMSDYIGGSIPHVTEQDKMLFLSILWPHRTNVHQWKSLWQEFSKVCRKLESMDSILAFQIQPVTGIMRGSPQQDAAFSTL